MDHQEFLQSFKSSLKKEVAIDLEQALESLFEIISDKSELKNELIHLEGRFNQLQSAINKGLIDFNTQSLQLNQIRESALQMISGFSLSDLNGGFSPELKAAKESHALQVAESKPEPPPPDGLSSGAAPAQTPSKLPEEPASNSVASINSFAAYELFVAEQQKTLSFYPRIYRRAREISIRRDTKAGIDFHQKINPYLPQLKAYAEWMRPIKAQIKTIRLDSAHQTYWLKYKMYNNLAATLEADNVNFVLEKSPALKVMHDELKALNLI